MAVNDLCWISLQVPDVEQSRSFWRELELRPGLLLALHPVFHERALDRRGYDRGGPVLGIQVMDLTEVGLLLERHGARPLGAVHAIPGGRARDYEEPDGYVIEIVELWK
jgi:catechol 2,3-dioxygenase-like lactoylglutathione lyase family enzyme